MLHEVDEDFSSPFFPYAFFSLTNQYKPMGPYKTSERTVKRPDPERGIIITEFLDEWGFHDFKVTEPSPSPIPK
jgi:hypothetical protein